jgi:hypothetical protein
VCLYSVRESPTKYPHAAFGSYSVWLQVCERKAENERSEGGREGGREGREEADLLNSRFFCSKSKRNPSLK